MCKLTSLLHVTSVSMHGIAGLGLSTQLWMLHLVAPPHGFVPNQWTLLMLIGVLGAKLVHGQ